MVCRLPSYDVCADLRRTPLILNRSIGEGLPTYKRKTITTVIQHGLGGLDLVLGYVGLVSYLGNLGMDLCFPPPQRGQKKYFCPQPYSFAPNLVNY